ncbi:hypothetical protein [Xanthomonas arboricola]|uniref:hypothetical protein n=1 Tax=Xanthomonas arboricola TaxID=56448 RepID=UPI0032E858C9
MKIVALLSLLLGSPFAAAQSETAVTFRDLQWGVGVTSIHGLKEVESTGDFTCHTKAGDKLNVGDAALERIRYCFYKGKFGYVIIDYKGQVNQITLKDVLDQKFGSPYRPNRFMDDYWWNFGKEVAIRMDYSVSIDKGTVIYRYKPVADLQAQDQKSSNSNAADDL